MAAFLIGGGASLYLINRDEYYLDKQIGYVMLWIILIQLFEAMMWADQKCTGLNQIATKLAIFQVVLQPLVLYIIFNNVYKSGAQCNIRLIMIIYGMLILMYLYQLFNRTKASFFCSKSTSCGLVWKWLEPLNIKILDNAMWGMYHLSLILPLFFIKKTNYYFPMFVLMTALISKYMYRKTAASWWCFFSAAIPIIKIFFPEFT